MGLKDWFTSKNKKPVLKQEIAGTGDGQDITKGYITELAQPSDGVLAGRGRGDLSLYEKVLSDEEVKRTFGQRQDALIAKEWKVDAASDSPQDIQAAEFIRQWLNEIGFDRVTKLMHYGIFYGYAVAELIYRQNDEGQYLADIKVRNRRRFRFTPQGELRLLTRDHPQGIECPAPYFWTFCTGADHDDEPYGIGLAHWLYWLSYFKRNGVKFWLIFLEKFGMPTALGRYPKNTSEPDQEKLLEALYAIQSDSGIIVPTDMPVELLSATRSGTADYKALWDTMNDGIQRVVLGQTTSSGGTAGRLGNDDLQEKVLDFIIKADADVICESFNRGPVAWLTKMNFANANPPRVYRVFDEPEDLTDKATRDKIVFETTGYRPTLAQVQESYGGEWEAASTADGDIQAVTSAPNFANPSHHVHDDAPAQMTEQLGKRMQPIIDDWLAKIRELVDKSDSLEQVRDELLTLYPDMDLQQYADAMAVALQAANLNGRYQVVEESKDG
ncbi:portal protein [Pasteurellaceae bacterium Orientalotternb1]|nr:portal protein [Pasteurellaceae bacterium Orientalotternb1]